MVASATMFGLMAFSAKLASARLSGPQVAMVRFAIGLLPVLLIGRARRSALGFKRWDLLIYRGFFGGLAVLLYFLAIQHMSAGVATLLNYTAPVWSGLFSILFIGERISPKVLIPVPIAFLGIMLVVRGNAAPGETFGFGLWELVGFLSGVASGVAVTAMRAARRTETSWSVYASFCIFGVLVTAPFGISTWRTPRGAELAALAATAIFAIFAQLTLTFSLRWVDAMTVGVISQLAVVVALVLGVIFLDEVVTPLAALGSVLTIGGILGVVYLSSRTTPKAAADEVVPEM